MLYGIYDTQCNIVYIIVYPIIYYVYIILYNITLYYIALHCIGLYYIILDCIVVLYLIVLRTQLYALPHSVRVPPSTTATTTRATKVLGWAIHVRYFTDLYCR